MRLGNEATNVDVEDDTLVNLRTCSALLAALHLTNLDSQNVDMMRTLTAKFDGLDELAASRMLTQQRMLEEQRPVSWDEYRKKIQDEVLQQVPMTTEAGSSAPAPHSEEPNWDELELPAEVGGTTAKPTLENGDILYFWNP